MIEAMGTKCRYLDEHICLKVTGFKVLPSGWVEISLRVQRHKGA